MPVCPESTGTGHTQLTPVCALPPRQETRAIELLRTSPRHLPGTCAISAVNAWINYRSRPVSHFNFVQMFYFEHKILLFVYLVD